MHAKFFEPDRTDAWTEEEQEPTVHHIDHQQALLIMMSFETYGKCVGDVPHIFDQVTKKFTPVQLAHTERLHVLAGRILLLRSPLLAYKYMAKPLTFSLQNTQTHLSLTTSTNRSVTS